MLDDSYRPFDFGTVSTPVPAPAAPQPAVAPAVLPAEVSPPVATCHRAVPVVSPPESGFEDYGKGADFREFQRLRRQSVTTVTAFLEGLPWADGLTALLAMPRPSFLKAARWDELAFDCVRFCRDWGQDAARFGWSDLELFGCNPQPQARRLDNNGLAVTLRGRTVLALDRQAASIDAGRSDIHTYRRGFPLPSSVPLWIALAPAGGP